ncbi:MULTISPECIES: DUF1328 domain-containing protein [Sphingobium]|uniref:UPF0391 membrane protein HNP60_003815 n=1 Tax=Sphingobium lignivorans TaxID=2735886 RepID=A0ABR6NKM9_9SPHN|nr:MULTISPECIES: DUF1328 family protein [Sphingobium]MBB5987841.1 uncharacterized membrane protein YtjA (UPF0391 family) [Sphingobium lignivorans]BAK68474.1 hypothetical protein SLG_37990 [Sphingobium sp. SYK-6]
MIRLAVICLIIAGIAALLGFSGAAGTFVGIAKILVLAGLALFVLFLVLGLLAGRSVSKRLD